MPQCEVVDDDPNVECQTCLEVDKESRKVIHRLPCIRIRLINITVHRAGGLNLTKRWVDTELKDVDNCYRDDCRTIFVSQGLFSKHHVFQVVRFEPREGDVLSRYWTTYSGNKETRKSKELAPYCFNDIQKTLKTVTAYSINNCIMAMQEFIFGQQGQAGEFRRPLDVIKRTYLMALDHYQKLSVWLVSHFQVK